MRSSKLLISILVAQALTACASSRITDTVPNWISSAEKACSLNELCAVGNGPTEKSARTDAMSELAKILETRVQATFNQNVTQLNDTEKKMISDNITTSSDVVLNSAMIKETYHNDSDWHALATLDVDKVSKIIRQDIYSIDEKMTALFEDNTPSSAKQLEKLYEKRLNLNQRYAVLKNTMIDQKYSFEQIFKNSQAKVGVHHIYLQTTGSSAFSTIVKSVLTENGYTFATTDNRYPHAYAKLTAEKLYLKVEGFVKYNFHFTLSGPSKNGTTIDVLAETFEGSGRDMNQAEKSILPDLKKYLSSKIADLPF